MVVKLRLYDSAFDGAFSASLGGENEHERPESVEWLREGPPTNPSVFTDAHIKDAPDIPGRKIAWILEPYELRSDPYMDAMRLEEHFDCVLTHDQYFANRECWLLYHYGGSWIHPSEWGMHPKTKEVSIIASEKVTTEGHNLRRQIADNFPLDVFGLGYNEIESKTTALKPYRFSVVVESSRMNDYFSEKLIDCLSMGTVPIYWGCEAVDAIFDPGGIIRFQSIKELRGIIESLSKFRYEARTDAIKRNIEIARQYRICEDNMLEAIS
jgi:hypothetical protein